MPLLTPKMITDHLLDRTYVREDYVDCPADQVWFGLMQKYAPDVVVELFWPEKFLNPIVTSRFPGIPLRAALEDLCTFCGVQMTVSDHGTLQLQQPKRVEAMKHAVVIEPDPRDWRKVEVPHVD